MNLKLQKVNTGTVYKNREKYEKQGAVALYSPKITKDSISFSGAGSAFGAISDKLTKSVETFSDYNSKKLRLDELFGGEFSKIENELKDGLNKLNLNSRLTFDNKGNVIFTDEGILQKFLKSAAYPFKDLWLDIAGWMFGGISKYKNSGALHDFAQSVLNSKPMKKRADYKNTQELFCIMQGALSDLSKGAGNINGKQKALGALISGNKAEDTAKDGAQTILNNIIHATSEVKGNYKTADERTINRLFTGLVSSTMAGIDFYNISRIQNDDDALAKKSQKKRFKQESSRILMSAAMTFLTLGALSKYANANKYIALATISGTSLVSEILSRLINGMPLHPLSANEAKDYSYHKHPKSKNNAAQQNKDDEQSAQQTNTPYSVSRETFGNMPEIFRQFENNLNAKPYQMQFKGSEENKKDNIQDILSFKNVLKAAGVLLVAGLGVGQVRKKCPQLDGFLHSARLGFDNAYDFITRKDFKVPLDEYKQMLNKIDKEYNMHEYAKAFEEALKNTDKYKRFSENINGKEVEFVKLGRVDKKIVAPFIKAITYPFGFLWGAIRFPSRLVSRVFDSESAQNASKIASRDLIGLYNVYSKAKAKMSEPELEKFIKRTTLLSTENKTGKSAYKNSTLAAISRPFVTLIASYFFVNDYRNEVLITSHGEDVEGANAVAKERVMHKVSNFFFNSLLMNLFNTVFEKTYHGSLLGAGLVAAATEFTNENLIRKSIGVPTRKMTRAQIEEHDRQNLERDDFWGKYFRFMSKLTGKKTISQKAKDEQKKKEASANQTVKA